MDRFGNVLSCDFPQDHLFSYLGSRSGSLESSFWNCSLRSLLCLSRPFSYASLSPCHRCAHLGCIRLSHQACRPCKVKTFRQFFAKFVSSMAPAKSYYFTCVFPFLQLHLRGSGIHPELKRYTFTSFHSSLSSTTASRTLVEISGLTPGSLTN